MERKPAERAEARRLRQEGMPLKRIAARLAVSPSSVYLWTRDIEVTAEQRAWNLRGPDGPLNPEGMRKRAAAWSATCRRRRAAYQMEGRNRAREGDPVHRAGCMLYWAEGTKGRNAIQFVNSDPWMIRVFLTFLRESLGVESSAVSLSLNVYTGNGLSVEAIENHWLTALELDRSCLRKHILDHKPTSSSGLARNKLPYGVCRLRVAKSTRLVQHIYGAIQEYGDFEEPAWLD
jgi:hypothetical protein